MPNTNAPKITRKRWRTDIGNPENGAMMVRIPTRIRMLGRDMRIVYQDSIITTNSPRTVSGWAVKCASNSLGVPEITSS